MDFNITPSMLLGGAIVLYGYIIYSRQAAKETTGPISTVLLGNNDTINQKGSDLSFRCTMGDSKACQSFREINGTANFESNLS